VYCAIVCQTPGLVKRGGIPGESLPHDRLARLLAGRGTTSVLFCRLDHHAQDQLKPLSQPCTGPVTRLCGGLVLVSGARRDAPAVADRDAASFRPRPDTVAALPARHTPPAPAALPPPGLAGRADERRELTAQRPDVLSAQVDPVRPAVDGEPHRLIGRAALPRRGNCTAPAIRSMERPRPIRGMCGHCARQAARIFMQVRPAGTRVGIEVSGFPDARVPALMVGDSG